jgi:hypothetical protein
MSQSDELMLANGSEHAWQQRVLSIVQAKASSDTSAHHQHAQVLPQLVKEGFQNRMVRSSVMVKRASPSSPEQVNTCVYSGNGRCMHKAGPGALCTPPSAMCQSIVHIECALRSSSSAQGGAKEKLALLHCPMHLVSDDARMSCARSAGHWHSIPIEACR